MEHQMDLPISRSALFEEAFALTVGHEGGFQRRFTDRGNWTGGMIGRGERRGTKYGISAASYPDLDIINITLAMAQAIYREDYWDRIRGDDLPRGLGYSVFDYAVNSGVAKASMCLQSLVNVATDGIIGPITLDAVRTYWFRSTTISATDDSTRILRLFNQKRLSFVMSLSGYWEYGEGWTNRIKGVLQNSFKMSRAAG